MISTMISIGFSVYFEDMSVKRKILRTAITMLNEIRYRVFIPSKG